MRKTNLNWLFAIIFALGFINYGNAQIIFEDDFSTDQGWTLTGSWERNTAVAEPSNDFTGEGFILANPLGSDYPSSMAREDATSPVFDCSSYTLSDSIIISLESFSGCESNSFDHMGFEVFDGTNWVSIWTNGSSFQQAAWTNMIFDVTQYAAGNANFQIRFYMGTSDGSVQYSGFAIDNFKLANITCNQPTTQNAINITAYTATLNWIPDGASNFNLVFGPQGFNMNDSTPIALTDTFYNVSNLSSETTYEFYVQDVCGGGDVSLWTGPYQFTTLITCPAPTSQNVVDITTNSATFTWITGGASNWNVIYGPQGFNMNDSTPIAVTDTFYNVINLTAETTYEFYVQDSCGLNDASHWVGPYTFTTLISCPAPTSQNVINITTNSASFTWITGGASNWNVIYGPQGFNMNDSTPIAVTDTFYNVTNLTSATTYEYYVQDSCGIGDVSTWSGPFSFSTDCGVSTPEYIQDFTSYVPLCWEEAQGQLSSSTTFTSTTTSYWISDGFGNVGTTGSARLNIYSTGRYEWLISKSIDLGTGVDYQLEFDLALTDYANAAAPDQNGTDDKFAVVISTDNGTTWSDANTLRLWDNAGSAYVYNDIPFTGTHIVIDLTGYTGVVKFGLYGETTVSNADNDLFVDNFSVREIPSCPEPYSLIADNIGVDNATISWTPFGSETDWNVQYDTTGFNLGNGITTAVTDTFMNLTGLNSGTSYEFYVQSVCGAGDESIWAGPYQFSTVALGDNCNAPISVILPADFTANIWQDIAQTTVGRGNNNDTTCLGYYDGGEDIFYEFTITEDMVVNITMDPKTTTYTGIVLASGCPSSSNCIETSTLSGTGIHSFEEVSLTAGTYFIMIDTWPSPNNIPDFDLTIERVTCPAPTNLTALNIMDVQADAAWTTGGASNWNIVYGPQGFNMADSTAIASADTIYTITGLTPETTYEFYVQDSCGVGDLSEWSGPYQFTTTASCPTPSDLNASNITTTSADLSWNGYFASTWDVEFGDAGFVPTGIPNYNDLTNDTLNIDTLTTATSYDFYVRADCGNDSSNWVGPFSFTTECDIITSFPYYEDFENNGNMPSCWSQEYVSSTHDWIFIDGDNSALTAYQGSYNAAFKHVLSGDITKLITPVFDLSGLNNPKISFVHAQREWAGDQDSLKLYYRTDASSSWTQIPGAVWINDIQTWTEESIILPNPSSTYQIAFEGNDTYGYGVVVDSVVVRETGDVDLAVVTPEDGINYTSCAYTGQDTIAFNIKNVSTEAAPAGTIYGWYELDGATAVADTFTLAADLNPTDTAFFNFAQTADLSDGNTHNLKVYMEYANDANQVNDTTNSTFTMQNPSISINQGDTMIIASTDFPKILSVGNTFESYFWYNEDSTVTGTNVQLIINDFGTYVINATDANGCVASDTIWVLELVGINSTDNISINIYPNPNNGEFTLSANFNSAIDFTVEMINIDGKTIYTKKFNGIKTLNENIDVDSYAKGIYYIRISNKSFVKQEKVVIY